MIPKQDVYADKDGNITDDPLKYARQIAVKGCLLDERIARRYGIADTLVSVDEPRAVRRVTGRNEGSVRIKKAPDTGVEQEPTAATEESEAAEAAPKGEAASPAEEEPTTEAKAKPAKQGAKKK